MEHGSRLRANNNKRKSHSPVVKMRVIGGGGMTNTAGSREEKQRGYSPSKSPLKESPIKAPTTCQPFSFEARENHKKQSPTKRGLANITEESPKKLVSHRAHKFDADDDL